MAARARESIADLKALLQGQALRLAQQLAPDGWRGGKYWVAKNPTRADRQAGSFWIVIAGSASGAWRDEATGDKGDIISLIAYCRGFARIGDTLAFAREFLGLARMPEHQRREHAERARASLERQAVEERGAEAWRLEEDRKRAFGSWLKGEQRLEGTLAEIYLRTRGIELAALAAPPRALRYVSAARHVESGLLLPAIVAAMTGPDDKLWAIHRTFLAPDGRGKAAVEPQRKIWPRGYKGSAIRLAKGETKMTPAMAAKDGLWDRLALCEGIEDGLSLALACPELRVWAVGSLNNLGEVALPTCAGEIIVCADNDWGKPQTEKQLRCALEALNRQGKPVRIARSLVGKDANDALRGAA